MAMFVPYAGRSFGDNGSACSFYQKFLEGCLKIGLSEILENLFCKTTIPDNYKR